MQLNGELRSMATLTVYYRDGRRRTLRIAADLVKEAVAIHESDPDVGIVLEG